MFSQCQIFFHVLFCHHDCGNRSLNEIFFIHLDMPLCFIKVGCVAASQDQHSEFRIPVTFRMRHNKSLGHRSARRFVCRMPEVKSMWNDCSQFLVNFLPFAISRERFLDLLPFAWFRYRTMKGLVVSRGSIYILTEVFRT